MDTKKVDKWLMIISGILLIVGLYLIFIFMGKLEPPNTLELNIGTIGLSLVLFSVGYFMLSALTLISNMIFKKLSNHFISNIWFKLIFSIIFVILILLIIGGY